MQKILVLIFALFCTTLGAQTLTPQQRAAITADITATPELAAVRGIDLGAIANYYNAPASPTHVVWRTSVPIDSIMANGMDWTRVDNLGVGKARIWDWMGRLGALNCSKSNIRAGIDATWVGTAADLAVRAMVYTHCKRSATRLEKLLSSGVGSDAAPALLGIDANGNTIEGTVSFGLFEGL